MMIKVGLKVRWYITKLSDGLERKAKVQGHMVGN